MKKSLGLIEIIGLTAGIVAADTAVKSANVELIGYELTKGSGMTVIKLEGDVGAVTAAVASAASAASAVGKVVSTKVIPRPSEGLDIMIINNNTIGCRSDSLEENNAAHKEQEELTEPVLSGEKESGASEEGNLETDVIVENTHPNKEADEEEGSEEILPAKSILPGTDFIEEKAPVDEVINDEENSEEAVRLKTDIIEENCPLDKEDNEEEVSEEILQEESLINEEPQEDKGEDNPEKNIKISQVSKKKGTSKKNGQKNIAKGSKNNKDDQ